jgi:site-specific DNA-adenine methylase
LSLKVQSICENIIFLSDEQNLLDLFKEIKSDIEKLTTRYKNIEQICDNFDLLS